MRWLVFLFVNFAADGFGYIDEAFEHGSNVIAIILIKLSDLRGIGNLFRAAQIS